MGGTIGNKNALGCTTSGAPTLYKPKYCQQVIELGRQGKSQVQIACALDVLRETMLAWTKQHVEFFTALKKAKALEQDWWESKAQSGEAQSTIGPTVWSKSVSARFKQDYTERRELSGPDGGPIEIDTSGAVEKLRTFIDGLADKG